MLVVERRSSLIPIFELSIIPEQIVVQELEIGCLREVEVVDGEAEGVIVRFYFFFVG